MAGLSSIFALGLGVVLIVGIVALLVTSIALWLATKLLKFRKQDYKTALTVIIVHFVISLVIFSPAFLILLFGGVVSESISSLIMIFLLIGVLASVIVFIYLIKRFYEIGWKEAILAWLIVLGIGVVVQMIISIILIPTIVLWQMGAFTPPSASKGCRGFSQITVLDWKASASNDLLQLTLTNEAGTKLRLDNVMGGIDSKSCNSVSPNTEVRPGRTYQANITNCGISNYKLGEYYRANITIGYRNIGSDIQHNSVGICWGGIE